MVEIQHGDLLEQRRGGVDVLRTLVRNLAVHEQSGAVQIRSNSGDQLRTGWLLFRLGHPVMAFHAAGEEAEGLEALLSIEEDAMDVNNEVELYELTMNVLRSLMAAHPGSVLHLEHQTEEIDAESWWSSVRLPSTSWRRAERLEDIEELALASEFKRRQGANQGQDGLMPGGVYMIDSPDPHRMLHLGVELAERGMPLLGLFGLPHADTDVTKRLPLPQCFALLSNHGPYEVLADREALLSTVNAFQWGNERSVLLLDGLDRLGNAMGDKVMVDLFRSICDGVRFNDHIVLCTTDLEMFETSIHHALTSECTVLRPSTLDAWLDEPDALWDHPILLAPDEEEEQWLAAQIQHQGAMLRTEDQRSIIVEGGSVEVDDVERAQATEALSSEMASWTEVTSPGVTVEAIEVPTTAVGGTPWRPETTASPVIEGRLVSDSPRLPAASVTVVEKRVLKRSVQPKTKPAQRPPELRRPQRLSRRKAPPTLPDIQPGLAGQRSSAVVKASPTLPEWPQQRKVKRVYRKENMDVFSTRQDQAVERHQTIKRPLHASALRDNVVSSPDLAESRLPATHVPRTVELPSKNAKQPLPNSLVTVDKDAKKPARESASHSQASGDIDEMYAKWSTFQEEDGLDATALYSESGEALKRYKGGS
jgi:hypothetical protein